MTTNFPILDLTIGLIFIYFLVSIITSSAVEMILTIGRARARILEKWLKSIFNQKMPGITGAKAGSPATVGQAIMDHCLTTARTGAGKATPYISASNFVSALLDKVTLPAQPAAPFQPPPLNLATYIIKLTTTPHLSNELKRTFIAFAYEAQEAAKLNTLPVAGGQVKSDLDIFRSKLEAWFDDMKDRLTDQLKRGWSTWLTAVIGAVVVIAANADSLRISRYLYSHPDESKKFADAAIANYKQYGERLQAIQASPGRTLKNEDGQTVSMDSVTVVRIDSSVKQLRKDMDALKNEVPAGIPMGWDDETYSGALPARIADATKRHGLGWAATLLAIMLGAPFWFDMLNKLANIRGTGPKPPAGSGAAQ